MLRRKAEPALAGEPGDPPASGNGVAARSDAAPSADPITADLTILGAMVRHAVDHVECFPAPAGVSVVRLRTEEISSLCPVTGQPDLSGVEIEYRPGPRCVESKSLKLYLWSFRDRPVFAEALAAEIAQEIHHRAEPAWTRVTVRQRPRGGITIEAVSELGSAPA
jgi:7-cyano-7-deazaguanine reductase